MNNPQRKYPLIAKGGKAEEVYKKKPKTAPEQEIVEEPTQTNEE